MAGNLLQIGVSGLLAHQAALRTTGHNISNADTEGFSRQAVDVSSQTPQTSAGGFQGTGVKVDEVRRVVDDFVVNQLRLDSSAFQELDTYSGNIGQIDALLADVSTGLAPGIQNFFASLHSAADDPSSIPVRQLVISQAEGLSQRFDTVSARLEQHNETLNQQISTAAGEVTNLARGIAAINESIDRLTGDGRSSPPNDLLDKRDQLLKSLSEIVSVAVVKKDRNSVDVFIGNGQALVIGNRSSELQAVAGETDPFRRDLAFVSGDLRQTVTSLIKGGKLGGILNFRQEVLDKAINSVGRLGLTIASSVNEQHRLGLDMDGLFGGQFFADINSEEISVARIAADRDNQSGNETRMSVSIDDTSLLTDTDYVLSFPGPGGQRYVLARSDNNEIVQKGVMSGVVPETISADGFSITLESGAAVAGDRFLVQPTRSGGREVSVELERPQRLALASAISAEASLGNSGGARLLSTEAIDLDTASFGVPGSLAPPIVIQFTSETTYDVLDNTNPARPADLQPPLRNLKFTPGVQNRMLPTDPGQTAVSSDGGLVGRVPSGFTRTASTGVTDNGYPIETLSLQLAGGGTSQISVASGEAAKSVAERLSELSGVTATARTEVRLSNFAHAEGGEPFEISVNGLAIPVDGATRLNPNLLADAISADTAFSNAGLVARSDGVTLTMTSIKGDDISIAVRGDTGDQFTLGDAFGGELRMTGSGESAFAAIRGSTNAIAGQNFDLGGSYALSLRVNGQDSGQIVLSGNQQSGAEVVQQMQDKIDASAIGPGSVAVSMGLDGRLTLATVDTGAASSIEIVEVSAPLSSTLGLNPSSAAGTEVLHEATVGGTIDVFMDEGVSLNSDAVAVDGNLFRANPEARSTYLGYQVTVDGLAAVGDRFAVEFNASGVSDNRNGLRLTTLETSRLSEGGTVNLLESYGRLVEGIGARTAQTQINAEASQALMQQSVLNRDSIAGVNLDEEAADLIRFEQAYNASAQVITVARSLFDTLLNAFR